MKKFMLFFILSLTQLSHASDLLRAIAESTELKIQTLQDGRKILASNKGLTLYTFDNDQAGPSTCFGSCLRAWPALITVNDLQILPFSVSLRPDGSKQIALENEPLYFYISDKKPGDIKGDGLGGVWHIIEIKE